MIRKKITLSTCESCTAGKLSSMITSVDGSSAYYLGSLITYSDQIKSSLLKISIDKILKLNPKAVPTWLEKYSTPFIFIACFFRESSSGWSPARISAVFMKD